MVLTAVFITLPFFKKNTDGKNAIEQRSNPIENPSVNELKKLESERELLYATLNDIEFDYGLGKLSREDYDELKQDYKIKAASVLRRIDELGEGLPHAGLEDELEKEIIAARNLDSPKQDEIEEEILRARKHKIDKNNHLTCLNCGNEYNAGDLFCSRCGVGLKDVS